MAIFSNSILERFGIFVCFDDGSGDGTGTADGGNGTGKASTR